MHRNDPEPEAGSGLARRLKAIRTEVLGLNQQQLASELGMSQAAISTYERGDRAPNADVLQKLRERFGIDANWLLTGHGFWRSGEMGSPGSRPQPIIHAEDVSLLERLWQRLQGVPPAAFSQPVLVTVAEESSPLARQPQGSDFRAIPYTTRMSAIGRMPMENEAKEGHFVVEVERSTDCRSLRCLKIAGDRFAPVFPAGSVLGIEVTDEVTGWEFFGGKLVLVAWSDGLGGETTALARLAEVSPHAVFEPLTIGGKVPRYADVELGRVRILGRVIWAWHPVP